MVRSKFNELQLTGRCHGSDYLIWHGERERGGGRGQTGRPLKMTHHGDKAFGPPVSTGPEQDEGNNSGAGSVSRVSGWTEERRRVWVPQTVLEGIVD